MLPPTIGGLPTGNGNGHGHAHGNGHGHGGSAVTTAHHE
jgi:hypothetical protein